MKMFTKIGAILLVILTLCTMLMPICVFAEGEENSETTPTTPEYDDAYCTVTLCLKDFATDETDEIMFDFISKNKVENYSVTFYKKDNWAQTISMLPGEYKISFKFAQNKREIKLTSNVLVIPEAKTAAANFVVDDVVDNNFLPKFFRNNSFTLILLVIASVTYFILKKRRESMGR